MKRRIVAALLTFFVATSLIAPASAFDTAGPTPTVISSCGSNAVVDENGDLWMWGNNSAGELGAGDTEDSDVPVKVMENVTSVSTSWYVMEALIRETRASAAVQSDGSLWTWGVAKNDIGITPSLLGHTGSGNAYGSTLFVQDHTVPIQTTPVKIMDNVASVSLGGSCALAIQKDGSLWVWGDVAYYEKNNKDQCFFSEVPVKLMDGVISACAGPWCIAAIKADGSLWVVGNDCLLDGKTATIPTKVMDNVAEIGIGYTAGSTASTFLVAVKKINHCGHGEVIIPICLYQQMEKPSMVPHPSNLWMMFPTLVQAGGPYPY